MDKIAAQVALISASALLTFAVFADRSIADSQNQSRQVAAQEIATADPAGPADQKVQQKAVIDSETESKATTLVNTHLSELKGLLQRLRNSQPQEYVRAMRDLAKSARKLELARNRGEELYDIEVELLQARTQANLLTAKLKVRDNERDRKQLRAAAERLHKATVARAQYDVAMYQSRVERAQRQLDTARKRLESKQGNAESQLTKSYHAMLRKAGRRPKPGSD